MIRRLLAYDLEQVLASTVAGRLRAQQRLQATGENSKRPSLPVVRVQGGTGQAQRRSSQVDPSEAAQGEWPAQVVPAERLGSRQEKVPDSGIELRKRERCDSDQLEAPCHLLAALEHQVENSAALLHARPSASCRSDGRP